MPFDGFYPRVYWADSKGFLGPGTHHLSAGFCLGGEPVAQVMQFVLMYKLYIMLDVS